MNKALIKTILMASKNLFTGLLIVYLVFFLLEVVLPGFISNNFNLNWVLGAVMVLGVLAAFAPEEDVEEKVEKLKKTDYLIFIGLGVIGGLLMFYKSDLTILPRIILAVVSTILISGFSLLLLVMDDKETIEEEVITEGETPSKVTKIQLKLEFKKIIHLIKQRLTGFRRVFLKPISLPAGALLIILILFGASFIRPVKESEEETGKIQEIVEKISDNQLKEPAVAPFLAEEFSYVPSLGPTDQQMSEALITVLNGNTQVGSASAMASYLRDRDFKISTIADADKHDYQNAIVRFTPEQQMIANYLIQVVKNIYPIVEAGPTATDSGEIILILGNLNP